MLKTLLTIGLACVFNVIAVAELSPYMKTTPVKCESRIDRLLAANWKKHGFPIPPEASDAVMVRRLYLDLAGRLPSPREARAYGVTYCGSSLNFLSTYGPMRFMVISDGFFDLYATMNHMIVLPGNSCRQPAVISGNRKPTFIVQRQIDHRKGLPGWRY